MRKLISRLTVSTLIAASSATGIGVVTATTATAAPNFQMPFPCGQVWEGQTRTNHSPARSVDFNRAGDDGDTVVASAAGTVSRVANEGNTSYGRWVEINHGSGYTTRYAHLSLQSVSVGQRVSAGQKVGNVGTTGGSTGPHLRWRWREPAHHQRGLRVRLHGHRQRLRHRRQVYLTYNSGNGSNCVATIKTSSIGAKSAVSAFLQVQGGSRATDSGSFSSYAGPAKKSAAKKCVEWGGSAGSSTYTSPYEHCG